MLYRREETSPPVTPGWSSTGKFIAFVRDGAPGEGAVMLLDCDSRALLPLVATSAQTGRIHFGEETLSLDGSDGAVVLWPHLSHARQEVEKF